MFSHQMFVPIQLFLRQFFFEIDNIISRRPITHFVAKQDTTYNRTCEESTKNTCLNNVKLFFYKLT